MDMLLWLFPVLWVLQPLNSYSFMDVPCLCSPILMCFPFCTYRNCCVTLNVGDNPVSWLARITLIRYVHWGYHENFYCWIWHYVWKPRAGGSLGERVSHILCQDDPERSECSMQFRGFSCQLGRCLMCVVTSKGIGWLVRDRVSLVCWHRDDHIHSSIQIQFREIINHASGKKRFHAYIIYVAYLGMTHVSTEPSLSFKVWNKNNISI